MFDEHTKTAARNKIMTEFNLLKEIWGDFCSHLCESQDGNNPYPYGATVAVVDGEIHVKMLDHTVVITHQCVRCASDNKLCLKLSVSLHDKQIMTAYINQAGRIAHRIDNTLHWCGMDDRLNCVFIVLTKLFDAMIENGVFPIDKGF
jgi:hypothetical protein